jgi:outer membrane protein OmpA-like peptidoglycan-associated protein
MIILKELINYLNRSLGLCLMILCLATSNLSARDRIEPFPYPATKSSGTVAIGDSVGYFDTDSLIEDEEFTYLRTTGFGRIWILPELSLGASYTYMDSRMSDPEMDHVWLRGDPTFFAKLTVPLNDRWWITTMPTVGYHLRSMSAQTELDPEVLKSRKQYTYDIPLHLFWTHPQMGIGFGGYYQSAEVEDRDVEVVEQLRAAWNADFKHQGGILFDIFAPWRIAQPFFQVEAHTMRTLALSAGSFCTPTDWLNGWIKLDYNVLRPKLKDVGSYAPRPPWKLSAQVEFLFSASVFGGFFTGTPRVPGTTEDERKAGIRLTVIDSSDGSPIDGAEIIISGNPQGKTSVGVFYYEAFLSGSPQVMVRASGFETYTEFIRVERGKVSTRTIKLRKVKPLFNFTGRLIDDESRPLSGYIVNIEYPKQVIFPDLESGEFSVSLKPGNYRLLGVVQGYEPAYRDVTIDAEHRLKVDFVLNRQTSDVANYAYLNRESRKIEITEQIHFEFGSSRLDTSSYQQLNNIAEVLRNNPDISISIEGHTDEIGGEDYNRRLSLERAQSIKSYLLSLGIVSSRLQTNGHGKSKPLCRTPDEGCRERNRRVEFLIKEQ